MKSIEDFLDELRLSPSTSWMANEIDETLSHGISMNVKDAESDSGFFDLAPSYDVLAVERNKRQKYETSRPYSEDEKVDVILKAIEVMYLDLL